MEMRIDLDRSLRTPRDSGWARSVVPNLNLFSVQPLCSRCLCGGKDAANTHHRDTENTEVAQRRSIAPSRYSEMVLTVFLCGAMAFLTSCQLTRRAAVSTATPTPTPSPTLVTPRLPYPKGFVNDYANVFDDKTKTRLEALLTKLRDKSNIEFAVATVDTTKGESIFNYSLGVAREWGVGPKDTSQGGGMLLMLAIKDRKWHLQVSRTLEADLPNDVCKELGDQSEELYKKGDYGGGVEKYVAALIKRLEEQRKFNLNG